MDGVLYMLKKSRPIGIGHYEWKWKTLASAIDDHLKTSTVHCTAIKNLKSTNASRVVLYSRKFKKETR